MVIVLDDLFGLPVPSGVVAVLEVRFSYRAVIQPDRLLSIVHL